MSCSYLFLLSWKFDLSKRQVLGPRLQMESSIKKELHSILHFLPMGYINDTILPATNVKGKRGKEEMWQNLKIDEFLNILAIFLSMEVYELHGSRWLHWSKEAQRIFPAMNYGRMISRDRFEVVLSHIQLSLVEDPDRQLIDFTEAVNCWLKLALAPGSFLTLMRALLNHIIMI